MQAMENENAYIFTCMYMFMSLCPDVFFMLSLNIKNKMLESSTECLYSIEQPLFT